MPSHRKTRQLVSATNDNHRYNSKPPEANFGTLGPPSSAPRYTLRITSKMMATQQSPLKTRTQKPKLRDSTTKTAIPAYFGFSAISGYLNSQSPSSSLPAIAQYMEAHVHGMPKP